MAWSFSEKLLTMVVQMVVSIIVARELMPEDFGVMAILTFFTSVALAIVDSGFSQALIRKQSPTAEEYASVLGFNVVVSLLLYVLLLFLTPAIARFYDLAVISTVAPVLFLVLPINSLCVVQGVPLCPYLQDSLYGLAHKWHCGSSYGGNGVWYMVACSPASADDGYQGYSLLV